MSSNEIKETIIFTMNMKDIHTVISKIQKDIRTLHEMGVLHKQIRIAMPNYFRNFLETYWRMEIPEFHYNNYNFDKVFFGVKICLGYNNEVCVFNEDATPREHSNQPIKIIV